MRKDIIRTILNLFKVKSILTFVAGYILVYMVHTNKIEPATVTAVIMLVFQSLFNKNKDTK